MQTTDCGLGIISYKIQVLVSLSVTSMARYQGQKSYVPCHLILQTYVIFQLELLIKVTFGHHCTIEISVTLILN